MTIRRAVTFAALTLATFLGLIAAYAYAMVEALNAP